MSLRLFFIDKFVIRIFDEELRNHKSARNSKWIGSSSNCSCNNATFLSIPICCYLCRSICKKRLTNSGQHLTNDCDVETIVDQAFDPHTDSSQHDTYKDTNSDSISIKNVVRRKVYKYIESHVDKGYGVNCVIIEVIRVFDSWGNRLHRDPADLVYHRCETV